MAKKRKEKEKKQCLTCLKEKIPEANFYRSNSRFHTDGRFPVCKKCLKDNLDIYNTEELKMILLEMNRPFLENVYHSAIEESETKGRDAFGVYMKNIQLHQFRNYTWKDSDSGFDTHLKEFNRKKIEEMEDEMELDIELDKKNKEDVLRMLGYDPFEFEAPEDRRHLYNKLVDYLDESTLEDSFKLPAVIEIVRTFNQIDKINMMITNSMNEAANKRAFGEINSLMNAKDKMYKSVLALAKDNGISVNHSSTKSKGAGTLGGIIKKLQEANLEEAEVNLFDIETAKGIEQVADISNKSIINQLQFDENDYAEMLQEQREILIEQEKKLANLEEDLRLAKKKLKEVENI